MFFGLVVGSKPAIADGVDVPEQVSAYFATGLMPRLAELYLAGAKDGETAPFDATAKVGTIRRVSAWTADFTAGRSTESPTELTNQWVAPISDKSDTVLGLATVWINPGSDLPELADFAPGDRLVAAVGKAPAAMRIVHDSTRSAWFATDGKKLVPLVAGTSGVGAAESTVAAYQESLPANSAKSDAEPAAANSGLVFAGVTLGVVVLLLAVVVLLPGRKRRAEAEPAEEPAEDEAADAEPVETDVVPAAAEVVAAVAVAAPKKATPKAATPRTAAPRTATPKAAAPRTATPKAATPKTAAPRTATPKAATPKTAAPKKAAPKKPAVAKTSIDEG